MNTHHRKGVPLQARLRGMPCATAIIRISAKIYPLCVIALDVAVNDALTVAAQVSVGERIVIEFGPTADPHWGAQDISFEVYV